MTDFTLSVNATRNDMVEALCENDELAYVLAGVAEHTAPGTYHLDEFVDQLDRLDADARDNLMLFALKLVEKLS